MTAKYPYAPDYAVAPGVTLKETLDAKGLSQADLAIRTGLAEKTVSQIINGIGPITYETAGKLEFAVGIPARFWNARERSYREALVRNEETERLEQDVGWLKELPLEVLIDRGHINKDEDKRSLVRQALRFFGVSSVNAWRDVWERPCVQFRGAGAHKKHPGHVAAWVRLGEIAAESLVCEAYNARRFHEVLRELRSLTSESAATWRREVVRRCAAVGVAVVFVKEIPGAGVSGITRWITKDKALIQLSLKYKTDDRLFFSFFHEAGHVLLHGKRKVFVEYGESDSVEEREADGFASDILIPDDRIRSLLYLKTRPDIIAFARMLNIAPGIVVGRMQHDGVMPRSHCNDLKRKLVWKD